MYVYSTSRSSTWCWMRRDQRAKVLRTGSGLSTLLASRPRLPLSPMSVNTSFIIFPDFSCSLLLWSARLIDEARGIMFSGCPSVCACVRPGDRECLPGQWGISDRLAVGFCRFLFLKSIYTASSMRLQKKNNGYCRPMDLYFESDDLRWFASFWVTFKVIHLR